MLWPHRPWFAILLPLGLAGAYAANAPRAATGAGELFVAPDGRDADPGTRDRPWATLQHAARTLTAGQTVTVRGGLYRIAEQIRLAHGGRAGAWITYRAAAGEQPVIDASDVPVDRLDGGAVSPWDQGAFQIEGVDYVRVKGLTIRRSHAAGFTVRDASHIELVNNTTENTFSSGIAVWDTNHDGLDCEHHRILGNTIVHATTFAMALPPHRGFSEPPHEAISIAGSQHFEVAWNHIYDSDKEGIDVKETSKHGRVHHNYVHDIGRQGLYVDAWFGRIEDVEVDHNVAARCRGAGLVFSVENGESVEDVRAHHNLLADNLGSGIFFSRWGDGPRRRLRVFNNTVVDNGYGPPDPGRAFFWLTGGIFLYSTSLEDVDLRNNLVSDNRGFQIGYSRHYRDLGDPEAVMAARRIVLDYNMSDDRNGLTYPISVGWGPDDLTSAWALDGAHAVRGRAAFVDASAMDFRPAPGSVMIDAGDPRAEHNDADGSRGDIGAFAAGAAAVLWWARDFPPRLELD
jgi:hypothetical protein